MTSFQFCFLWPCRLKYKPQGLKTDNDKLKGAFRRRNILLKRIAIVFNTWRWWMQRKKNPPGSVKVSSCDTADSCGCLGTNVFSTIPDNWGMKHQSVQDACESKHAFPRLFFGGVHYPWGFSLSHIPSLPGTARPFWREMPAAVNCTQVVRGLGEACARLCLFARDSIHLCHSLH